MKKIGFLLAPNSRVAGSLILNRELFIALNEDDLKIEAVMPDTDDFYKVPIVGSLLNYFTLYRLANKFDAIIGTSFATLPFINSHAKIIQQFHSTDTGSYDRVLSVIKKQNKSENLIMNKWLNYFNDLFNEKIDEIYSRMQIALATEGICARRADKILAVSPSVKDEIVKFFHVKPTKIKVIMNGIGDFWFNKNKSMVDNRIYFVSRANTTQYTFLEKGIDRTLEIMSKVSAPISLIFHYGTSNKDFQGRFKTNLQKQTKSLDKIYSNISQKEIKELYKPGGVFLQTSRTEACQLTLLEAMASGIVPVTFPVGIAPEIIKNGKNGFIINSVEEAVELLNRLFKEPKKLEKIANEARQTAESFRFKRMVSEYKKEITGIIK